MYDFYPIFSWNISRKGNNYGLAKQYSIFLPTDALLYFIKLTHASKSFQKPSLEQGPLIIHYVIQGQ